MLSLDVDPGALERFCFQQWQAQRYSEDGPQRQALLALVNELFFQLELDEQAVLREVHLKGRSANAVAKSMGLHHSTIDRLKTKAESKLRAALEPVMRFQELERAISRDE